MDFLVLVLPADPDHQLQQHTLAVVGEHLLHLRHHVHHLVHLMHMLQLTQELELQGLCQNQSCFVVVEEEPAPLSSQYPQLFDLLQTQHHDFSHNFLSYRVKHLVDKLFTIIAKKDTLWCPLIKF